MPQFKNTSAANPAGNGSSPKSGAFNDLLRRSGVSEEHYTSYTLIAIIAGILILGFIIVAFFERQKQSELIAPDTAASVLLVLHPEVFVKSPGAAAFAPVSLDGNIEVNSGTEVQVASGGQAAIFYPNGTLTTLNSGSHIVINTLEEGGRISRATLLAGSIWARVGRVFGGGEAYEVQSGNFVTSVRGTEFEITAHENGTFSLSVLSNVVAITLAEAEEGLAIAEEAVRVPAGERITLPKEAAPQAELNRLKAPLSDSALQNIVLSHAAVDETLQSKDVRERARETIGGLVSAGTMPDSAIYGLERALEAIGSASALGRDARALRHLSLADERLAEVEGLVEKGAPAALIAKGLENYDRELNRVLAGSRGARNPETSEIVALATGKHTEVLARVVEQVPEEARAFVRSAQATSRIGHLTAVEVLARKDTSRALLVSAETMNRSLREAQSHAAQGDGLNAFDALQNYDRLVRLGGAIQENDTEFAEGYAGAVGKTLRTIETVDSLVAPLPPGYKNTVVQVRDRSVKNHIASIATVANEKPEAAVSLFADTSDYYLATAKTNIDKGKRARAEEVLEAYEQYADFGAEMAGLARELRAGEVTVRELVEHATAHHGQVLQNVIERVPAAAQEGVTRAISNIEKIQTGKVERVEPEAFKEQRATPPKLEDLQSPVAPVRPERKPEITPTPPTPPTPKR